MMSQRLITAVWAVFHSFIHGFHISALNGVQDAVTCNEGGSIMGLRRCLDIDSTQFGIVVTIYTLGGLLGSLLADNITRKYDRLGTIRVAETAFLLGTAAVGLSNSMWLMAIGRIAVGIGSGLALVTIPLLLNEISSRRYKASFGMLHQVSIGVGMICAQSLSIPFAKPWEWRWVLLIGFAIAAILFLTSGLVTLMFKGKDRSESRVEGDDDERRPLVRREEEREEDKAVLGVKDLIRAESVIKRGVLIVVAAQFAQQICGISPVMYFSTKILAPVFQGDSKLVALTLMAAGIPFNFVPGILPSSIGTRRLLLISTSGTCLFAFLLAFGLNMHNRALSAFSVFAFVLSFSIGLAPLPWVVLSEVVPPEARTAGGAVAVSVNWLTNFAAGAVFLPLQQALKHGTEGEGNVFFVFTAASGLALISIALTYKLHERAAAQGAQ